MNNKKIDKRVIQLYEKLELSNEIKLPEKDAAQLIRHGAHIIFQLDTHNHFIYLNPAWETTTGLPVAKTVKLSLLNFVHEQDHDYLRKKLQLIRTSASKDSFHTECRLKVNNTQIIHDEMQLIYSPENNKAQHVMGIMVDISKHKIFLENFAPAIPADRLTIWDVDINRERRVPLDGSQCLRHVGRADTVVEFDGRRIARIARYGALE